MNNRFGIKELVVSVLLILLIISVWLAMDQFDRQWSDVKQIQAGLKDQSDQLQHISEQLGKGIKVSGSSAQTAATQPSSFPRLRAAQKMPGYAHGDWCIHAFANTVSNLTPLIPTDAYSNEVQSFVLQGLAQRDPNTLKWEPLIAQSWAQSKDGLTIIFRLRHDVTFSDGQPLTSADVVYTFNLIMNPRIATPRLRAYYDNMRGVKAVGPYTVIFTLKKPYFQGFEICATMQILPKHFYSKFTPQQINSEPGLLMGSGPYKLAAGPTGWQPGTGTIELVRNNKYWGVAPALDKIIWRIIPDPTARLTAFRNGKIDIFGPNPTQYKDLKDNKQLLKKSNLYVFSSPGNGYRYVAWNEQYHGKKTMFADRKVRQAMTMLVNRQRICDQLMQGLARTISGPFSPGTKQYDDAIKPWPYDPAKAKELLKQAGYYDRNGDGVIDTPEGKPFEFKLIYPSGSPTSQSIAMFLHDAYAQAGIKMDPEPLDWSIMLQRINQRDFQAMMLGWTGGIESDPYQIFDSSQISNGGDNYTHYINHQLDKVIETARRTMDVDKRMEMWHEVQKILHIDQPYTFLFASKSDVFISNRFHNVQRTRLGLNDETEWFVPKDQQRWK